VGKRTRCAAAFIAQSVIAQYTIKRKALRIVCGKAAEQNDIPFVPDPKGD
jgi:hypothetical protein